MQRTLVVNAGSSSLKLGWLPEGRALTVERIGPEASIRSDRLEGGRQDNVPLDGHEAALERGLQVLMDPDELAAVEIVGHRVVHGGERYTQAVVVDREVESAIESLVPLAPLHNPANLAALRSARRQLPDIPHVAVFDTAFHASLPAAAYLFGLPRSVYRDEGVRRYGFHGPSHDYVTRRGAEMLGRDRRELRLVSLHLGNGASAAAVAGGRCVDTTMGLTPLDGLLMGTRCGDLDPGVVLHLLRSGRSLDDVDDMLNKRSGLLGLSEVSNDMRDVRREAEAGNDDAREALAVFGYRVRKTIGAFVAAMGGLDAVIFTAGIGENDAATRSDCLAGLETFGIAVDEAANRAGAERIDDGSGRVAVLVVPTNEERMIAQDANEAVRASRAKG